MGREVRRVPVNYKHPKNTVMGVRGPEERYIPLFYQDYEQAVREWQKGKDLWEEGNHPDQEKYEVGETSWEDWYGQRPDPDHYFPEFTEPREGWCLYETVSEGTPVTPVFESAEDLIDYLVENGDFVDQSRRARGFTAIPCDPWPRNQAEQVVLNSGWRPSMVIKGGKTSRFAEGEG